jgi:predicted dehydrogenase
MTGYPSAAGGFWTITPLAVGLLAVAWGLDRQARADDDGSPVRVGIIGLDTSHAPAFVKLLNSPGDPQHVPGCRVVAAYPKGSDDIPSSVSRVPGYTEAVRALGVEIVDSIETLVAGVDCVLLESNDGRVHLRQAAPVLAAGRPLFIDKPMAASLADVIAIFRLAREHGTPVFSSSALRFAAATQAVRGGSLGAVIGCDTYSPCSLEPTHPDLFWYGIHGCEALFTVMGLGCEAVTRTGSADGDLVTGTWSGGRIGTFRGIRRGKSGFGGTAFGTSGITGVGTFDGYRPLVVEIARFFETRTPPVDERESIELFAFMEAADESRRRGGAPVPLAEVIAAAERTAEERLGDLARPAADAARRE